MQTNPTESLPALPSSPRLDDDEQNPSPSPAISSPSTPPSAPSNNIPINPLHERARLDRVEHDLLRDIHRIQAKLAQTRHCNISRHDQFGHSQQHAHHPNPYPSPSSSSPHSSSSSPYNQHQHVPPNRVISVSLRLPHNDHRASARQQLFDTAIPPKATLSLPEAVNVPFVWVGSDPPDARPDPDSVVASSLPTSNHQFPNQQQQHHSSRRRRRRQSMSPAMGDTDYACHPAHRNVPVSLPSDPEVVQRFHRFCEHVLWRLLHYDYIAVDNPDLMEYWAAYCEVNQRFADTVAEICEEGDIIWVHNFHLMLFPAMLRDLVPYARIGFFLYTPFPSAELFRILPHRTEIIRGVVAADVIGFHSYDHARQFTTSARRLLMLETTDSYIVADPLTGRTCKIGIYPGGIDADALRSHVTSKLVKSRVAQLRARFEGIKIVVGVDRLDDCFAGLLHKLLAFERLLSDNPQLVGHVVLVQAAMLPVPGRNISTYREQRIQLNKCVAHVNSKFGSWSYSPIHFINKVLDPTELHALMCVGHVCVVTTVRDGMGLVPHEWTVCQHGAYNGPIVLSEFSSAAHSFSTALHVNPWDIDEVAAKIKVALDMGSSSRHVRNEAAYRFVTSHTAQQWGRNFLDDIDNVQKPPFAPPSQHRYHHRHRHQHQQRQDHQQQSEHFQSAGLVAGPGIRYQPATSPSAMKPILDTCALVHSYLGTSDNMQSSQTSAGGMGNIPGQTSANIASSPLFVFGEHLSKMMRSSSTLPETSLTRPNLNSKPSNRSFDSTASLTTSDSGEFSGQSVSIPSPSKGNNQSNAHGHFGNGGMAATTSRLSPRYTGTGMVGGVPGEDSWPVSPQRAKRACLFILDIDGTLTTGALEKADGKHGVSARVIEVIQALVDANEHNYVLVTSCHTREVMLRAFGDMRVYLAAEDGAFVRAPGSTSWSLLFRDTGISSGGRKNSPGSTVHDGDHFQLPSSSTQPGVAEAGTLDENFVQSRLVVAVKEDLEKGEGDERKNSDLQNGGERRRGNGNNIGDIPPRSNNCNINNNSNSNSTSNSMHHPNNAIQQRIESSGTATTSNFATSPTSATVMVSSPLATTTFPINGNGNGNGTGNGTGSGLSSSKASMSTHTSFSSIELGPNDGEVNVSWKESVMPVLQHFAERTPGVVIREGETLVTWEYTDAECDYGHWQSRQVHKHLESSMLRGLGIGIACEEGARRRWIRIRPKDVDKAKAVQRFIKYVINNKNSNHSGHNNSRNSNLSGFGSSGGSDEKLNNHSQHGDVNGNGGNMNIRIDFIVCFGDDRADEPVFELLRDRERLREVGVTCSPSSIFTCKVGAPVGRTAATAWLDSPARVLQVLRAMCGKEAWALF